MPHHNTVFHHQVQKMVPWAEFDRLVEEHGGDYRVRTLKMKDQFLALLFARLSGSSSLREVQAGTSSHACRLYHVGGKPVKRSTLSDANSKRPSAVYMHLLAHMIDRAGRGLRRKLAETTYLIDSTSISLTKLSADWARFSSGVCGAKLHVILDPDADHPVYAEITAANVNDITAAHDMPIKPGATYLFDLGYYDYAWWAELDAAGCLIVTRLKRNTRLEAIEERPVEGDGVILSDRVGCLPRRQANSRTNPMQDAVREIRVKLETGPVLRILSNDLDADAQEIADSTSVAGPSSCSSVGSSRT